MKMKHLLVSGLLISLMILGTSVFNFTFAQTDSTNVVQPDTAQVVQPATTPVVQPDTTTNAAPAATGQDDSKKEKKSDKKKKDAFIVYAGVNFNDLSVSSSDYESLMNVGYQLGAAYKRGKFFYWQVGARFNHAGYLLKYLNSSTDSSTFAVNDIDIPLTGGINVLAPLNRIVALRVFVSAVPAFTLGVPDNDSGITKDDINSFILYGQGGIGVDVLFLLIEVGYNYGFQDLLKNQQSNPGQLFVNLGFRF